MNKKNCIGALVAAGVALAVSAAVATPTHAEPPAPPATSALVIHKMLGAPVDAAADGTQQDTSTWTGVTPVNGVVFDLYEVGAAANPAPPAPAWPDIPPMGAMVMNAVTGNLEVYSGTDLIGEYSLTAASTASVTTASGGVGTAAGLASGLYLVVENVAASTNVTSAVTDESVMITAAAAPFTVSLPMLDPTGDSWLDTVHVYPKNQGMTVDKVVSNPGGVAVGDTISYTITVSVPQDIANSKQFNVLDKLDPALDAVVSSVKVSTTPALSSGALVVPLDYFVDYKDATRTLAVSFVSPGRVKLAGTAYVSVMFDAKVNASILSAPGQSVTNTATVEFTNSEGTEFTGTSNGGDESTIHSASISVTKVDGLGMALNGASFKIATSEANAKAGNFMRVDSDSVLHDYDASPTSTWATLGAGADVEISPANQASFTGLVDFVDDGGTRDWKSYWVVETVAPATYNQLTDPIEVSFQQAFDQLEDPADYNYTYALTVKNSKGFLLPQTGGAGIILWTVAGVVLIGVAVLVALPRRRVFGDK